MSDLSDLTLFDLYKNLYDQSIQDPERFWFNQGQRLFWSKPYTKVKDVNFASDSVAIKWYEDGQLNACYNCIDRHLETKGDHAAIIFEGDDSQVKETLTYLDLYKQVVRCANVLKELGIEKGDRVAIYLPMIPLAAVVMLACARIGAIHCVIFGGFSPESLASRIIDCSAKIVITTDVSFRGGKAIKFKENVDKALAFEGTECVQSVLTKFFNDPVIHSKKDIDYDLIAQSQSEICPCEAMNAEDPLFILYTSGSTGKPKGLVHTTGGYLVYTSLTHEHVFDIQENDIYWCTADVGWITGHSYVVYGPLCNGVTTVMFEGVPHYPDYSRYWQMIDRYAISVFYTAPTALRSLKSEGGDDYLKSTTRSSLRVLGTVGEPIDPTTWHWYFDKVGLQKAYVVDTWWQTETGGHMITPIARYNTPTKAGSVALPFFGVKPVLLDVDGNEIPGAGRGSLCVADSWPGQARTMFNAHKQFEQNYFSLYEGYYTTGDGAERDEDGYYWITGRIDDVLSVSGHRLGTNELESALCKHKKVAETAVVGYPHAIKGQGIYAYVVLYNMIDANDALKIELTAYVRKIIGPIATIDVIHWAPGLPKTRSGKIMRRILRKISEGEKNNLGDTSTLADESVVKILVDRFDHK